MTYPYGQAVGKYREIHLNDPHVHQRELTNNIGSKFSGRLCTASWTEILHLPQP